MDEITSTQRRILAGLSQGSALSSLLYNMHNCGDHIKKGRPYGKILTIEHWRKYKCLENASNSNRKRIKGRPTNEGINSRTINIVRTEENLKREKQRLLRGLRNVKRPRMSVLQEEYDL